MFTGMELMACQDLAISAEVMEHVVHVESSANPYAIGVVGSRLVRQPRNLGEALATVHMLDAGNYNYSLGLAQVNRVNLHKYGLDSYQKAFMPCPNVAAGAQILADCYADSGSDWGKAFSCYYSGNFVSGYRDGYVRKIYDSISRSAGQRAIAEKAEVVTSQTFSGPAHSRRPATAPPTPGSPAHRAAIRSTAVDIAAVATSSTGTAATYNAKRQSSVQMPASTTAPDMVTSATGHEPGLTPAEVARPGSTDMFVPKVRGPEDLSRQSTPPVSAQVLSASPSNGGNVDRADLRKEHGDAAFVF